MEVPNELEHLWNIAEWLYRIIIGHTGHHVVELPVIYLPIPVHVHLLDEGLHKKMWKQDINYTNSAFLLSWWFCWIWWFWWISIDAGTLMIMHIPVKQGGVFPVSEFLYFLNLPQPLLWPYQAQCSPSHMSTHFSLWNRHHSGNDENKFEIWKWISPYISTRQKQLTM